MDISLTDSVNNTLRLTTDCFGHSFDVVTFSPLSDEFSVRNRLRRNRANSDRRGATGKEAVAGTEIGILPPGFSSEWRVLVTPTLRLLDTYSRDDTSRLMTNLFLASQAQGVAATKLLISNFAHVRRYPERHILGILDALKELSTQSFQNLRLLCLDLPVEYWPQFERTLRTAFATRPIVAQAPARRLSAVSANKHP